MKVVTPEIVWHGKEPVFSADFHRRGDNWRLATGGADNNVRMWKVVREDGTVTVEFLSSLARHSKAVNVVRFSPDGGLLASAGDDEVICLWRLSLEAVSGNLAGDEFLPNKENWTVAKMLRGHIGDVYDLHWSSDSKHLVSGSVDNTAVVWDVQKGQLLLKLTESRQYVQGVCWDPLGQYVSTFSSDRNLRIYAVENKFKCIHTLSKVSTPDQSGEKCRQVRMWVDESLSSFFRRHTFTPDGSILIVPAGRFELTDDGRGSNCTFVFSRNDFTKPVLQLPSANKPTVAASCSPLLYQLRTSEGDKMPPTNHIFSLPYRMVYAVASLNAILFYDTQHLAPFAYVSDIHYASITDIAWSKDGQILVVTSTDGYCSLVAFDPDELGIPLSPSELPPAMRSHSDQHQSPSTTPVRANVEAEEIKKSSSIQQQPPVSSKSKPRRIRPTIISSFASSSKGSTDNDCSQDQGLTLQLDSSRSPLLESSRKSFEVPPSGKSGQEQGQKRSESEAVSDCDISDRRAELVVNGGATCAGGAVSAPQHSSTGSAVSAPQHSSTGSAVSAPQSSSKNNSATQSRRVDFVTLSPSTVPSANEKPAVVHKMPETGQSAGGCREEVGGAAGSETHDEPMEVQTITIE